ncbi:Glutathione S-transferase zeta-1 [Apophysomyces sp. BC1034]|nr:Glutathione S-transferase zeta-1 [Apophysomyces sp. BC1015]KAG0180361.1 Glutathione S-transferase zeta-1 [Apophysomyces sp. BC1021]KAG0190916.1 Glutathione S-transferase zeta-1 [Apophysomyces sp. BC1034]
MSETHAEQKPILYGYYRSSASYRVRIALAWKGVEYEHKLVNLLTGDNNSEAYGELNPSRKVPLLMTKDGLPLTQSVAILEYLEEAYPERPMLPKNIKHRAQARAITNMIACDIHPLQNLGVLKYVGGDDQKKRADWACEWINRGFRSLEKHLESTAGTYCVGDHITMADFSLVPMVYNAVRWGVDMKAYPLLTRINNTLLTLPEFKSAHPHSQEDCPPELRGQGV